MKFIDIPTEQTTAATDAILAVIVMISAIYLKHIGKHKLWKSTIWAWAFYLLSFAALSGAIAHGFIIADELRALLWHALYLALGLFVALFVVGSVYDIWGEFIAKRILLIMLAIGAGFFCLTLVWSDSFIVFIIYEAVALFFVLGVYVWLAYKRRIEGSAQMVAGVLITIVAAGIQASHSIMITFIWQFDHNGVFHLVQTVGVIILISGLRAGMLTRE
ncbi:MAG: hypothetical protein LJE83_03210 [Gammaproteobacteria bacterium]|nr:hypothetical protein [Gammaproteobacteria bacterium]